MTENYNNFFCALHKYEMKRRKKDQHNVQNKIVKKNLCSGIFDILRKKPVENSSVSLYNVRSKKEKRSTIFSFFEIIREGGDISWQQKAKSGQREARERVCEV